MPVVTFGETHPKKGSWVFCVLNFDGTHNNIFFAADEAHEIISWVHQIGVRRPEFASQEFWLRKAGGKCRIESIYKAIPRAPLPGNKSKRGYAKFEIKSKRRCVGSCPGGGPCIEVLDPVTHRLKDCRC